MVLTHTTTHTYSHPFPTVTLAYFLRYSSPKLNPFSTHVLSTDTIERRVDPATGRLHTTRIHLKKSRMPAAIFKLLPTSVTGGGTGSDRASYILETSVVDIKEGWMRTESRNLNFTGVLSVVEHQHYSLTSAQDAGSVPVPRLLDTKMMQTLPTSVTTTVVFRSRLGERLRARRAQAQQEGGKDEQQSRWLPGLLGGWGAKGVQRTIENLGFTKTQDQLGKSREGMRVVLERLRGAGVSGVLEMVRRERQVA